MAAFVGLALSHIGQLAPITLVEDGVSRLMLTQCSTVEEVLDDLDIAIQRWDRVEPALDAPVKARMTIAVEHARLVTIVADGATRTLHTRQQTIEAILDEADLHVRASDKLWIDGSLTVVGENDRTSSLASTEEDGQAARSSGSFLGVRAISLRAATSRGGRRSSPTAPISHIRLERATLLYVNDGGIEQAVWTTSSTIGQALRDAQVLLYLGDRVQPSLNTEVRPGLRVRIERALPVSVQVDGRVVRTRTHQRTVGEVLAELGISLVGRDVVEPSLDAAVAEGLLIRVTRIREETLVEQDEIAFETVWLPDSSLELDHRRVEDAGGNGLQRRRYRVVYHDGQEVERYLEDEWVAREPQPRRIAYGTRIVARVLETASGPIEYWRRIRVFLTSYTEATCGKAPDDPWYGITRLGWKMGHGIVAVDPRLIRLRSQLYVPGYGRGVAGDTGGLIKGRHIDLGYDVNNFVMHFSWGYVYVLTPVPPASQIPWILPDYPRERADGGVSSFTGS